MGPLTGCASSNLREERDALWMQNQELQEKLNSAYAAQDALEAERSDLRAELESRQGQAAAGTGANKFADIEGIETFRGAGTITVRIPGDVLFASGKVDLKAGAKRTLGQVASVIQREYSGSLIRVEGYTDTDPIRRSRWKDNLELSLHRAASVHRYLQKRGVSADRMYAAGFGEGHSQVSKAKSRRVEIVVVFQE